MSRVLLVFIVRNSASMCNIHTIMALSRIAVVLFLQSGVRSQQTGFSVQIIIINTRLVADFICHLHVIYLPLLPFYYFVGYLMHEFHKFWIDEDPLDIMEFNRVREKFYKRILRQLQNPEMALCPHFAASESLINM